MMAWAEGTAVPMGSKISCVVMLSTVVGDVAVARAVTAAATVEVAGTVEVAIVDVWFPIVSRFHSCAVYQTDFFPYP